VLVPDTVTEAVALLAEEGYHDELRLGVDGLHCDVAEGCQPVDDAVVDHVFRFEGPSDPADEAIVLGVSCPVWGLRGVLVSGFGPSVDPEHAVVLTALARRRT
jgi:hypothetical protein